jgi:hypothetical protein
MIGFAFSIGMISCSLVFNFWVGVACYGSVDSMVDSAQGNRCMGSI